MPRVTCTCGKSFTATRANAKYCSDRCRKRTKRSGADVVSMPPRSDDEESTEPTAQKMGPVETAAHRELLAADRVGSFLGQTALATARKIDDGVTETGSAFSSLSKELRATMLEALRGTKAATAPQQLQDELAARRAKHA